ncbi:MAG TPA: extracellular solute-binding protein [Clostridia bacterium]|nr:extracellular solute-binding protein [Clostridia bacterium]
MEAQNQTFGPTSPAVSSPPPPSAPPTIPQSFLKTKKKLILVFLALILLAGLAFLSKNFLLQRTIGRAPTTITYWGLFEPEAVFQQVIADYEKEHPEVKINYSQENLRDYRERLQAALTRQKTSTKSSEAGVTPRQSPDIFRIHQTWIPMLADYLSPMPASVYDAASFEQAFYASAKESLRWQSQYLGIPLEVDGLALYYNEDLFKAAGKVPPQTWGELKKTACQLTVRDSQGKIRTAGIAMGTTNNVDHWSDILGLMMLQNGVDPANPAACSQESGAAVGSEQVCLGRDALIFYTIFATDQACQDEEVNVGAVWDQFMPTSTYAFSTGMVAMYFGPSWRAFEIKELNPNLNFKVIAVPQLEGKKIAWSSYWVEAVSKSSASQTQAWEFLKYLSSEKVMQKLYQTESVQRGSFGEPYSRVGMADLLKDQPFVSAFIEQAPYAQTWYLCSRTSDNGINDKIIKYYEDAVNAVHKGQNPLSVLTTTTQGVNQVLQQYGLLR